jgi:alginate O-acetyltransferase complex protein AlgI
MLFNSVDFIFLFLPIVLAGYYLLGGWGRARAAVVFLTAASFFFYGYWDPANLPILLASIVVNYALGYWLLRCADEHTSLRLLLVSGGIVFDLLLLAHYKYTGFFLENIGRLTDAPLTVPQIILPIGISFFTFQQIAFLVDAYRRRGAEPDFVRYCLFITFFPHFIAGPITHHSEMMPQFKGVPRSQLYENLSVGLTVFAAGLFKKVVVADSVASFSTAVFDQTAQGGAGPGLATAWAATLSYSFQIYFDFSAYSDMAIGLGKMFGIRLPINFASPYQATSIIDFWRRWHITLSRFLRDYLYIPLGGGRGGRLARYRNIFLTMVIGGVWHGAGWTFLLWGMLHGGLIVINHAWRDHVQPRLGWKLNPWLARVMTLLCVVVAWVPFRAQDFDTTLRMYRGLFGLNGLASGDPGFDPVKSSVWFGLLLLTAWVMLLPNLYQIMCSTRLALASPHYPATHIADIPGHRLVWRPRLAYAGFAAVVFIVCLLKIHDVSEFIYFQF